MGAVPVLARSLGEWVENGVKGRASEEESKWKSYSAVGATDTSPSQD